MYFPLLRSVLTLPSITASLLPVPKLIRFFSALSLHKTCSFQFPYHAFTRYTAVMLGSMVQALHLARTETTVLQEAYFLYPLTAHCSPEPALLLKERDRFLELLHHTPTSEHQGSMGKTQRGSSLRTALRLIRIKRKGII